MKRREFLSQLGLLSALSISPKSLYALSNATIDELSLTPYETFRRAFKSKPQLIAYQSLERERAVDELLIEGEIPSGLNGSFYRNGPALFERDQVRYEHLFEGDGMVHAFEFNGGKVSYKNKFIQTNKFKQEQAAERFLYDFSGIGLKDPQPITSPDSINPANINVLPVGDELWALWEAGSPHALNPKTLKTKGIVTLGQRLKGMPFSAHPKVEADGTIWNFGLDYASGSIIVYRLNAQGTVQKTGIVPANYHAMLHDFLVTERHILLILPSVKIDPIERSFMKQQKFAPDQAMRVLVVDKNDLSLKSIHEFPPCFIFHYGNAWEDKAGNIQFDGCRYPNLNIMQTIGEFTQGITSKNKDSFSQSVLFTIFSNGQTKQEFYDGMSEFPRIYPTMTGLKNDLVFSVGGGMSQEWLHSIRSLNTDTGKTDEYDYGDEYLVEEHIVVENGKQIQQNGWLIGTALHWPSKRSCVSIFNADNISAGPVARAWLPFHMPLGFHGNFKSNT